MSNDGNNKGLLCPCGKPTTRRKYCSEKCMKLWSCRTWQENNKEKMEAWRKVYNAEWRKENRDRLRKKRRDNYAAIEQHKEYAREWYQRNKERIKLRPKKKPDKAKKKAYYQKTKEHSLRKSRAWYLQNKATAKEHAEQWRKKNRQRYLFLKAKNHRRRRAEEMQKEMGLLGIKLSQGSAPVET